PLLPGGLRVPPDLFPPRLARALGTAGRVGLRPRRCRDGAGPPGRLAGGDRALPKRLDRGFQTSRGPARFLLLGRPLLGGPRRLLRLLLRGGLARGAPGPACPPPRGARSTSSV